MTTAAPDPLRSGGRPLEGGAKVLEADGVVVTLPAEPKVRILREVAYIAVFYALYSLVRNQFGSATVSAAEAYRNAITIIDLERSMGIFNEAEVQSWFLDAAGFLRGINIYYGTLHFVVPIGVLVFLALRHPTSYPLWRTALLATTAVALVGYALFPLMPPRLLCDCAFGAGPAASTDGLPVFVDTLAVHGGLWSFDSATVQAVSNQYAAMPSLHIGWALWCSLALLPFLRHWWSKALAAAYPVFTLFTIVVTGNHFWLDAVGGVVVVAIGYAVARLVHEVMLNRRKDGDTVAGGPASKAASRPPVSHTPPAAGRSTVKEASAP